MQRTPSMRTWLLTRVIVPVSALVLMLKLLRVLEHPAADSLPGTLNFIASDLLFLGGLAALALLWILPYAAARNARALLLAQLVFLPVLCIELGAQLFYITTGDILSWPRLSTYFTHVALLSGMVISAPPEGSLLLVFALMLMCALIPWFGRRPEQALTTSLPRWLKVGLPLLLFASSFAFPLQDLHKPFGRQATLRLAASATRSLLPSSLVQGAPRAPRSLVPTHTTPRNVILILMESTGAHATSLSAPHYPTTPALARQAELGAHIARTFAVVPHTTTALYALHCGSYPDFDMIPPEHGYTYPDCLPGLLRDQGYQTAYFQGASLLFENNYAMLHHIGYELTVGADNLEPTPFKPLNYFGYAEKALLEPGRAWLEQRDRSKPFLLTFMTLAPHHDYKLPAGFTPRSYHEDETFNQYLNCVAYSDEFVAELLDMLQAQGVLQESVVALIGDHGEAFGEHKRVYHDNVIYQETLGIPFVLRGPGIPAGTRIDTPATQLDVMPTLAGLAGFELRGEVDGIDLLDEEARSTRRELVSYCWLARSCAALIAWPYKLIHHYGQKPDELFDLEQDPGERSDLIATGRVPEGVDWKAMGERLSGRLVGFTSPGETRP